MRIASIIVGGWMVLASLACSESVGPGTVCVSQDSDGQFSLMVNGEPFEVKGVGGTEQLPAAVKAGANSFRTWGVRDLEKMIDGKPVLDYAHENGLYVTVGLWVGHERHGFNYHDEAQVQEQRERIRQEVRRYKDHPAVLLWGLGNEMEGADYRHENAYIWDELNVLAGIVKEEDPNHPVMTVLCLPLQNKLQDMAAHYPNLDILGVNAYGGAPGVVGILKNVDWAKPVILSEFGPLGQWEVGQTAWGAPIEMVSTEKASFYLKSCESVRDGVPKEFLGSYAFLWGSKHEATPTWYGMFLDSGEKLASVDVMTRVWSGEEVENHCPVISPIQSEAANTSVEAGSSQRAEVNVNDPEKDPLKYEWILMEENKDRREGGDQEAMPDEIPGLVTELRGGRVKFKAPDNPGEYRLYVYVRDGEGGAATANMPFRVKASR